MTKNLIRMGCSVMVVILSMFTANARNENITGETALYVPNTTLNAGQKQILSVNLKNSGDVTAFQFDIKLPAGVTVNMIVNDDDETVPDIQLTERKKSRHQLSCYEQADGNYRIVVISMANQSFRDNDGPIVKINVTASTTMTSGEYGLTLSNIHIVPLIDGIQGERIDQTDYTTTIVVNNASEGGEVNVMMYVSTTTLVAGQKEQNIGIALANNIEVTAFQFDIELPLGIVLNNRINEDDETVPDIQLTSRKKSSHSISCNKRGDGRYTVVVLSMQNQALKGTDGDVVILNVDVPITMSGRYDVVLSNMHIVPLINGTQGIRIDQPDVVSSVTISNEGGSGTEPSGANTLTVAPLTLRPGEVGILNINMTNQDAICSFQFNIKFPEGISVVKEYNEDDEYVEAINLSARKKNSHELTFKQTMDGGYFLIAYSLSNATFRDNDGAIVSIKIKADEMMQEGNYGVIISNVVMVTPDENKIEQENYSGTLMISSKSGVDDVVTNCHIKISVVGSSIVIDSLSSTEKAEVYNISGELLTSIRGNDGASIIDCSSYKNQTLIIRVVDNRENVKSIKFNL